MQPSKVRQTLVDCWHIVEAGGGDRGRLLDDSSQIGHGESQWGNPYAGLRILPLAPNRHEIEPASMFANTSQCQLQEIVLGSDVADFAIWRLVVTCRGCCICPTRVCNCGRCPASDIPVSRLPPGIIFATVLRRLRCASYGSRADRVFLDNLAPDWQRCVIRVWERGSYG